MKIYLDKIPYLHHLENIVYYFFPKFDKHTEF